MNKRRLALLRMPGVQNEGSLSETVFLVGFHTRTFQVSESLLVSLKEGKQMKRITVITLTLAFLLFLPANTFAVSWNKRKLAGTTYWGGGTFGFYATK